MFPPAWLAVPAWLIAAAGGLDNSLARRPPLGWMSWGFYGCSVRCDLHPDKCLNEQLVMSVADTMDSEGYAEEGYEYVVVDDCWAERERAPDGRLQADRVRFPRGIKFLADYLHARRLKLGLYGSVGDGTCMGYPGSRRHLRPDAETFAAWGVDYVKMDGCFVEEAHLNTAYVEFGEYLNKTGRPMVFSCSWPYYIQFIHQHMPDYARVAHTCNLWRSYHDVERTWRSVRAIVRHHETSAGRLAAHTGPGRWNDPDMIIVGTGMLTPGQSRVQLAVWAVLSAPLLLSCDLKNTSSWERTLLLNSDLLAVNQDPLGLMAIPHKLNGSELTLWLKRQTPLKADKFPSFSLALVNLGLAAAAARLAPRRYGLDNLDGYIVMDIFARKAVRNVSLNETLEISVPAEDVVLYTLFPL